jgi:hypothetical protein
MQRLFADYTEALKVGLKAFFKNYHPKQWCMFGTLTDAVWHQICCIHGVSLYTPPPSAARP